MSKKATRQIIEEVFKSVNGGGAAAIAPPTTLEAYYEKSAKNYHLRVSDGAYIPILRGDLAAHLMEAGWSNVGEPGELTEVDREINRIQSVNHVDYVGPLSGRVKGFTRFDGSRCLINSEPSFVKPCAGDWSVLDRFMTGLFGATQIPYVHGWIKVALEMFHSQTWRPGQVMFVAGPPGAGKNLFANVLGKLFGGRQPGKPYASMTGRTDFNSDIFGAEILTIEDEVANTSIQARRDFGAQVKMMAANNKHRLHPKGRPALVLEPLWRVYASLNDQPERLLVVPPVEPDIEDKMMLFLVEKKPFSMPTGTAEEMKAFLAALHAGIPAFVHHLNGWAIPSAAQCPRYGVTHYHHPELLKVLQEMSPEQRLLELIDEFIFTPGKTGSWRGRSTELDRELKDCKTGRCAKEAEKLLQYGNNCGAYLSRLKNRYPDRVSFKESGNVKTWTIQSPDDFLTDPNWPKVSPALVNKVLAGKSSPGNPSTGVA